MTNRWPCIVVTTFCCLLAVVASAQPASRWMLWERQTYGSEGTTWRGLEAFGTERECRTAALREARLKYLSFGRTKSPQLKGSRVEVPVEFETQIFSYDCLPDTVDPRGPKGK